LRRLIDPKKWRKETSPRYSIPLITWTPTSRTVRRTVSYHLKQMWRILVKIRRCLLRVATGIRLLRPRKKSLCRRALDLTTPTCKELSEWKSASKNEAVRSSMAIHSSLDWARPATRLQVPSFHSVPDRGKTWMQRIAAQTWHNPHIFPTGNALNFTRLPSSYRNLLWKNCEQIVCWSSPSTLRSSSTPSPSIARRTSIATSNAKKKSNRRKS